MIRKENVLGLLKIVNRDCYGLEEIYHSFLRPEKIMDVTEDEKEIYLAIAKIIKGIKLDYKGE